MPDLLVKLFDLSDDWSFQPGQEGLGILIRKPLGPERQLLIDWVRAASGDGWASEMETALGNRPQTCFVAIKDKAPIGFACYDAAALGFFGPIGIIEEHRGEGTGKALLMACLLDMKLKGYGYAVIGWAEPAGFYRTTVGAFEIPHEGSARPGVYKTMLHYPKGSPNGGT
jgi:GNAT superfamily N-acetyltransferase